MFDTKVRIFYPAGNGELELRTSYDWTASVAPDSTLPQQGLSEFILHSPREQFEFKPVLKNGDTYWAYGSNYIAIAGQSVIEIFPQFTGRSAGILGPKTPVPNDPNGRAVRVWVPPGFHDNTLKKYKVLYIHDGHNIFEAIGSFAGVEWNVDETAELLTNVGAIEDIVVVGIYGSGHVDRLVEYNPFRGGEEYASFIVETLMPWIQDSLDRRLLTGPQNTAVMGSSMGGLISLWMAYKYPKIFGMAAAMSGSFRPQESGILQWVRQQPKPNVKLYIDWGSRESLLFQSYRQMIRELIAQGFSTGTDLMHFTFPSGDHDELSWGNRVHLPLQFFFGKERLWVS
jgi:predicted alpha/beta superfamily hydrolase